jgi:general stress protein 26
MRRVSTFAEIEQEFMQRIKTMVYCSAATIDSHQRPRSRVLHPIWEGATGWVTTDPSTAKAKQLAANPHMSLAFIADPMKPVYVECRAVWQNDPATRQRIWDLYKTTPEPLGSDLAISWGQVENPQYAVLRLDAWRIELYDLPNQHNRKVWMAEGKENL